MNSLTTALGETETRLDRQLAYCVLRLTLGINILIHGLVRLPQLAPFADGLAQAFAKTPLPPQVVRLFAFVLPFAETFVGLLLTLGLWTRLGKWRIVDICARVWHRSAQRLGHARDTDDLRGHLLPAAG
jgi:uncharacterized membrane protein YphA (DoxX/SURF4 family)